MTDTEIDTVLVHRGYRSVKIPREEPFRSWLWVEPVREGPKLATKLCQWGGCNLDEEGLHFLLDHYCELKGNYYTDEDRRRNIRGATC